MQYLEFNPHTDSFYSIYFIVVNRLWARQQKKAGPGSVVFQVFVLTCLDGAPARRGRWGQLFPAWGMPAARPRGWRRPCCSPIPAGAWLRTERCTTRTSRLYHRGLENCLMVSSRVCFILPAHCLFVLEYSNECFVLAILSRVQIIYNARNLQGKRTQAHTINQCVHSTCIRSARVVIRQCRFFDERWVMVGRFGRSFTTEVRTANKHILTN